MALNEEQRAIRDTFHAFAAREIRPRAQELDETATFPRELFRQVGELGFFGMRYPPPDGSGADLLSYLLAVEELAWGSLSVAAACTMQSLMGTAFLHRFLTGELRERLFVPALRGDVIGTICMTEPDAGSDLFAVKTRAVESETGWVLSGRKTWITSAPVADVFTVLARTGDKELSLFLVERGAPGLVVGRSIEKLGVRASLTSELAFEDTPAVTILGKRGGGAGYLREILAEIRLMTGALAIGLARAAFEDSLVYSKERKQFGKPIGEFQAVQIHLSEMAVDLAAARRLVHGAAAEMREVPARAELESSMAKLFASEAAVRNADRAARIHGSYGFASELPIQRYLRDSRFLLIGGGTSEILKVNIAKGLGA